MVILRFILLCIFLIPGASMANSLPFSTHVTKVQAQAAYLNISGVVEAVKRSTVSAQTSGRITQVNFDIGDYVKAGGVLVRISRSEQQPQLAAADALQQEAGVRLREAKREHKRVSEVYAKKLVAKSALDKAEAELDAAQKRYEAADAKAKQALARLKYTTIKAPYSGYVVQRFVDIGETVTVGKPIMRGLSLEQLRVNAHVPQSQIERVRALKTATIVFGEHRIESTKLQVSPQADPESHAFLLRAYLPQGQTELLPGMFVKLQLKTKQGQVLLVPEQALVRRSELTAVYVVDQNSKVILRQVRTGHEYKGGVEILAGLRDGETIALDPIAAGIYLKDKVKGAGQ